MKISSTTLVVVVYFLLACTSCHPYSKLYLPEDKNRLFSGRLEETTFDSLRQIVAGKPGVNVEDTIIIKYDYNNETCWDLSDQNKRSYIEDFITRKTDWEKNVMVSRPNISVFDFREPGNNLNKIKKWDSSITIDSSKQLFNLLFKQRSTCGNSIIVLPDRRFVFLRSDAHFEVLNFTHEQILQYLAKK